MAQLEVIRNKWQQADKITGACNVLTLTNGDKVTGKYVLCSSGSATASHNALKGFAPSEGFPTDQNGGTVNDRDYQRDQDAQRITREIAANYDARAAQNPVIVSHDGVIISGNGRTMAGELAAHNGTDAAYLEYLRDYGTQYGFNADQVSRFAHARVLFEIDDDLPYNAKTFAIFNAQEMKGQCKTEQAIKFGKLVDAETFGRIVSTINAFETLSDFYACTEAAARCIGDLRTLGVISGMQYAEMFDGDTISSAGRETLENVLIGKAFADDPDAARKITSYKNIRKSVVIALGEVSNNLTFGSDYTLSRELSQAIALAYQARKEGDYKDGEKVSIFARQMNIFDGGTVADYTDDTVLLFADILNDKRDSLLKKVLAVYNHQAQDSVSGQTDMFSASGIKTKDEILQDVKTLFATGTPKEQKSAVKASVSARVADSLFLTDKQLTSVVSGSYVEYVCKSGDVIICKVESVKNITALLIAKGGIKFTADVMRLRPTANHTMTFPDWLRVGEVITDGTASQRIQCVSDSHVIFDWINGGYYEAHLTTVLQKWQPSGSDVCKIIEAA